MFVISIFEHMAGTYRRALSTGELQGSLNRRAATVTARHDLHTFGQWLQLIAVVAHNAARVGSRGRQSARAGAVVQ